MKVILGSWPAPSDEWTEEYVLGNIEGRPVNLVSNRTSSLQKLANRRPDVVVFGDVPLDAKTYLLAFGRIAPVQVKKVPAVLVMFFRLDRPQGVRCFLTINGAPGAFTTIFPCESTQVFSGKCSRVPAPPPEQQFFFSKN